MKRVRPYPFDRVARLSRSQVEAGRALLAHLPLGGGAAIRDVELALGGAVAFVLDEAYAFPVRELPQRLGSRGGPAAGAAVAVRLAGPFSRGALILLDPTLASRLARRNAQPAPSSLLSAAEEGALLALCQSACADSPVRVEGLVAAGADTAALFPDPLVLALDGRLKTPVGDGWARLLAPDQLRVRTPLPRRLGGILARRKRLADARLALPMEVGRTRLPRADFAGIAPRDVVLFEDFGPRPPFGGPALLRLGRGGFPSQLGGDGLTILEPYRLGDWTMAMHGPEDEGPDGSGGAVGGADDDEGARASTDALLRELPVELVCELGRVMMSGRELLELRPGAVIPVGRPLAGPVDLTVGGRIVARGELVDVEGEIGVRITQVND